MDEIVALVPPGRPRPGRDPSATALELAASGLGLDYGTVVLVESDERWPLAFERLARDLKACLGDAAVAIEHVGSTAVPGLVAEFFSVLARLPRRPHDVPLRPEAGTIAERFPEPVAVGPALLEDLCVTTGLSARHVELLTGQPADQLLDAMHTAGIAVRPFASFSPWRRRKVEARRGGR